MRSRSDTQSQEAGSGFSSLTRLLPYAKPFRRNFLGVLALVLIYNASSVLQPYLVKVAIDSDISASHPNPRGLLWIGLFYMLAVAIGVAANYLQILTLQYTGQSIIRQIRIDLFAHIEKQAMEFFDKHALGRLVTNVSSDTETVNQFFTQFFLSSARDGLSIVMIIIAMFELNAKIALDSMVVIPVIFLISWSFRIRLRRAYQATRTLLSSIVSFLAENLAGMSIIQIFHQERRQAEQFSTLNLQHRKANIHEYGVSVMFNRMLELLGNVAVAAMVYVGGIAVLGHAILFGTLYAFISYIRQFFGPINSITQQWNTLQSSMVAADRIGKVLQVEPAIQDAKDSVSNSGVNTRLSGKIEFKQVSFAYLPDEPVLHDISFSVEPGSFVGFVGATGAGKSSIMSLLSRFYEPTSGAVYLDGTNIQNYLQSDLHQRIGLVQQDVYLFTGTVADNIRMFRPSITDDDVRRAAERVGAREVIESLPQGYETRLYAKGANLSMGERQLISFARVVALNPEVLILDEATANLDSQTEALVQAGLKAVAENRTTLVIAHRLSTIRHADQIIVLDKGRICERGTHEELVLLGGLYAQLYSKSGIEDSQFRNARIPSPKS